MKLTSFSSEAWTVITTPPTGDYMYTTGTNTLLDHAYTQAAKTEAKTHPTYTQDKNINIDRLPNHWDIT